MSAVRVVCPEGVYPGDEVEVATPGGTVLVSLPSGVRAGEEFEVSSPKAWPNQSQDQVRSSLSAQLGEEELYGILESFEAKHSPRALPQPRHLRSGRGEPASARRKERATPRPNHRQMSSAEAWRREAEDKDKECRRLHKAMAEIVKRTENIVDGLREKLVASEKRAELQAAAAAEAEVRWQMDLDRSKAEAETMKQTAVALEAATGRKIVAMEEEARRVATAHEGQLKNAEAAAAEALSAQRQECKAQVWSLCYDMSLGHAPTICRWVVPCRCRKQRQQLGHGQASMFPRAKQTLLRE